MDADGAAGAGDSERLAAAECGGVVGVETAVGSELLLMLVEPVAVSEAVAETDRDGCNKGLAVGVPDGEADWLRVTLLDADADRDDDGVAAPLAELLAGAVIERVGDGVLDAKVLKVGDRDVVAESEPVTDADIALDDDAVATPLTDGDASADASGEAVMLAAPGGDPTGDGAADLAEEVLAVTDGVSVAMPLADELGVPVDAGVRVPVVVEADVPETVIEGVRVIEGVKLALLLAETVGVALPEPEAVAVAVLLPLSEALPDAELLGLGAIVALVVGLELTLQEALLVAVFMGRLLGLPATPGLPEAVELGVTVPAAVCELVGVEVGDDDAGEPFLLGLPGCEGAGAEGDALPLAAEVAAADEAPARALGDDDAVGQKFLLLPALQRHVGGPATCCRRRATASRARSAAACATASERGDSV